MQYLLNSASVDIDQCNFAVPFYILLTLKTAS